MIARHPNSHISNLLAVLPSRLQDHKPPITSLSKITDIRYPRSRSGGVLPTPTTAFNHRLQTYSCYLGEIVFTIDETGERRAINPHLEYKISERVQNVVELLASTCLKIRTAHEHLWVGKTAKVDGKTVSMFDAVVLHVRNTTDV